MIHQFNVKLENNIPRIHNMNIYDLMSQWQPPFQSHQETIERNKGNAFRSFVKHTHHTI